MTYRAKSLPPWVRFRPRRAAVPLPNLSDVVAAVLRIRAFPLRESIVRNNALLDHLKRRAKEAKR